MEQKFIDRDGLKVLWNQVNLKDYPNNETLMAVIDAIDETKANKNELFSKSWNDLTDRPDWIKEETKPNYTVDEIEGAVSKEYVDNNTVDNLDVLYNTNRLLPMYSKKSLSLLDGKFSDYITYYFRSTTIGKDSKEYKLQYFLSNIEKSTGTITKFDQYFLQIKFEENGKEYSGCCNGVIGMASTFSIPYKYSDEVTSFSFLAALRANKIFANAENPNEYEDSDYCCLKLASSRGYTDEAINDKMVELMNKAQITLFIGRKNWLPVDNTYEYIPTNNYHPATKKYVDDNVIGHTHSWNDLEDRPFYKEPNPNKVLIDGTYTTATTTWDGTEYVAILLPELSLEKDITYIVNIGDKLSYTGLWDGDQLVNPNDRVNWEGSIYPDDNNILYIDLPNDVVGTEYYVTIEDYRDYIYKFLPEEFLPVNLGRSGEKLGSWIFENHDKISPNTRLNKNSGTSSVIMGYGNTLDGGSSLIVGLQNTTKNLVNSLVVGADNKSTNHYNGINCGSNNDVMGMESATIGTHLITKRKGQLVTGRYNVEDTDGNNWNNYGKFAHIVGNGENDTTRSNAHTLDWDGNAWYKGDVYIGGTGQGDENVKKLATEEYVDSVMPSFPSEMEALALVTEIGFVEPVTNNGYVLTDENGAIYTI